MTDNFIHPAIRCAALWTVLAGHAFGQPITVAVSGTVLDPSDAVISGASVALSSGNRDLLQTKTDANGEFRFNAVARGRYELRAAYPGFKAQQTGLRVRTNAPAPVRIVLPIADLQETVKVESPEGRVSAEASENVDVIRLDPRQLEALPMLDRDVIGVLSQFLNPAATGAGGPTVIIDGLPSTERKIPLSEIEEIRINNNPYSAEFARPGKGRIEITTKSGSSKYHGTFYFGLRDYRLDARNAFAVDRQPDRRRQFEANLSGPVHKGKKNTFSLGFSRLQDNLDPIVYAFGVTGPIRENAPQSQTNTYFSVQFTRRIDKNNALSIRYTHFDWSYMGQGTGGFNLPGTGTDSTSRYHQLYSSYKTVISPKLLNEFLIRLRTESSVVRSEQPGVPKIVVLNAFTSGGAQVDANGTDNRLEFSDMLAWSHGRHLVKAGVSIPALSRIGSNDRSISDGWFSFSSLEDYAQRRPYLFMKQTGDGHLGFWQEQVSGFVQDEIKLRQNLSVALGVRYEWQNYISDYTNLAPRFSFAYAPGKGRNTVFRGGAGIFYDTVTAGAIGDALRFDGSRLRQIQLLDPSYPDPFLSGSSVTTPPSNIVRFDPTLRSPHTFQYSIGVDRQLRKSLTLSTSYTRIHGVDLFRSRDVNAPLPPLYLARPDLSIGAFRQIESSGGLKSQGLDTTLRGDLSRFFTGMIIYELRRASNDTDGIGSSPANNWDPQGEWSRASFDMRHFFYLYGTLTAGKYFKFGAILSANSGRPYTMTTGLDQYNDGKVNARPPGVPRNSLQGTGAVTLDLRWSKEFRLHRKEGPGLVAGVDAFNLFNRVNYTSFVGNLSSPFFGQPVAAAPARRVQLSLTMKF